MVCENKLAMLWDSMIEEFISFSASLWVMEESSGESGERWSWIEKYTCSSYVSLITPVTVWGNEVVSIVDLMNGTFIDIEYEVWNSSGNTILSLFNINTDEFKGFEIHCQDPHQYIFNYAESLVPPGNFYIEEP